MSNDETTQKLSDDEMTQKLRENAGELRPMVSDLAELAVSGVRFIRKYNADDNDVWTTAAMTIAKQMKLDFTDLDHVMIAAMFGELIVRIAQRD